ncbi:MAG TPA: DNA ligase D [Thermoanaerobaculia bacterium]|jgi:bifunctional non-homologous end joining protein LigD|nr:DNA ligase D [Thermoanaerobaculia bacterium]
MGLQEYKRKRDFKKTPEPAGKVAPAKGNSFVIQKHAATRLHYDFRLEMEGVLRSWAVPKGPSLDPGEKRLAVHVEDHPLDYGDFEGIIPKGQYGGGTVLLWDHGTWYPDGDPVKAYKKGHIKFRLEGEKLHGGWHLVRLHGDRAGEDKENWLLFKDNDDIAVPGSGDALVQEYPASVTTGLTLEEIAANPERVWQSNREEKVEKKAPAKKAAAKKTAAFDPSGLTGARKAKLPAKVEPQLATLVTDPPRGEEWIHELKFDGYRVLCELKDGNVRMVTRSGKDWTDRFGPIVEAITALPATEALLDGEAAVLLPNGTTSFQALQNALGEGGENLVYFAFDLLHLDGYDLRPVPLLQRKEALTALLASQPKEGTIRLSDHVQGTGEEFYRHACDYALEGIISKRADQPYQSGRSKDWLKVKCLKRQEMVIVGFTDPEGSRSGFGALLLAVNEGKDLVYAGKVGTGFNTKTLNDLRKKLDKLEIKTPAFKKAPRGAEARRSHWVEPKLVGEVAFTEWTEDGILRHPTFQGLREDKSASEVVREVEQPTAKIEKKASAPKTVAAKKAAVKKTAKKKGDTPPLGPERDPAGITEIAGVKISNPDRVLYPEQGLTKRELALFYERIQAWILPHLKNRPLTMVRCPSGQGKQCFYQKHVNEQFPASIKRVQVEEGGAAVPYGAVDSLTGLIYMVQMGVLELHIWGSHIDDIEKPDYIVFDLDPDEGLSWERVVEGTIKVREKLEGLGLRTWLKTTGGKGLHVCVPITRRGEWDEVKAFTKAVVESIVADEPDRYTSKLPKASRKGKIFIDYLRNGRGATSIGAYSTRARPGAPVSTPLFWEELETDVRANTYNVRNLPERLESLEADPWADFLKERQSITAAMKKAVGMK